MGGRVAGGVDAAGEGEAVMRDWIASAESFGSIRKPQFV